MAVGEGRTAVLARRRLRLVLLVASLSSVAKLYVAATTHGTNDVHHWEQFAAGVRDRGPIGIYSLHFVTPYNHPPLIGWMLVGVNGIAAHWLSVRFLIRALPSLADVVTAFLIFELVRVARGINRATLAAVVFSLSPVAFVISGFHGNTDPLFVMLLLLSAYLLVLRDRPAIAGACAAIAVSIKLVPIVAIPVIGARLARDPRRLVRTGAGFLVVFGVVWTPAILRQWNALKTNVLGYTGTDSRASRWGLVDFARNLHHMNVVTYLIGPGRFLALVAAACVPAVLVLRKPDALGPGIGLSLAIFLLLSPAFGTQYLVWPVAGLLILDLWSGTAFSIAAGILLVKVYTRWSGGVPWDTAVATRLTRSEEILAGVVWFTLLVCVVVGIRRVWQWPAAADDPGQLVDAREATATDPAWSSTPRANGRSERGARTRRLARVRPGAPD